MGRGDKKTKKGKISMGSYGNSRPHKQEKAAPVAAETKPAAKTAAPAKSAVKKK